MSLFFLFVRDLQKANCQNDHQRENPIAAQGVPEILRDPDAPGGPQQQHQRQHTSRIVSFGGIWSRWVQLTEFDS